MALIEVDQLSKTYTTHRKDPGTLGAIRSLVTRQRVDVHAVRGVSFQVEEGELVGFLGPNGAGKTTTLKMLSGILYPSSGVARVMGHVPWQRDQAFLKRMSIVMGQKNQLWWDLPAWESLLLLGALYEVPESQFEPRVYRLAEMLGIRALLHTQVRRMSLGERMKCELLAALLNKPRVVFLDEPTIGLDVVSQKSIREFLKEYNRTERATILLTSHYMQDVRELCDRVIIIDHGTRMFDGSLNQLVNEHTDTRLLRLTLSEPVDPERLRQLGEIRQMDGLQADVEIPRERTAAAAARALSDLPVADIAIQEVDIDEVIRTLFTRNGQEDIPA